MPPELMRLPFFRMPPVTDKILVVVNVGGAVVPVASRFTLSPTTR